MHNQKTMQYPPM